VRTRYHFLRDDSEWNGFCELIFDARWRQLPWFWW
jgi:hypothetical protein